MKYARVAGRPFGVCEGGTKGVVTFLQQSTGMVEGGCSASELLLCKVSWPVSLALVPRPVLNYNLVACFYFPVLISSLSLASGISIIFITLLLKIFTDALTMTYNSSWLIVTTFEATSKLFLRTWD